MTIQELSALVGFAFAMSASPGPSNLILLSSGLTFGFRRSLPIALGVCLGVVCLLAVVGAGLGSVMQANATAYAVFRLICVAYVLYLAWQVARSAPPRADAGTPGAERPGRPMRFFEAALLQWVNPKAWTAAIVVAGAYFPPGSPLRFLIPRVLLFGLVNFPSVTVWALFGMFFRKILSNAVMVKRINVAMAILLVATMVPVALDIFAPADK